MFTQRFIYNTINYPSSFYKKTYFITLINSDLRFKVLWCDAFKDPYKFIDDLGETQEVRDWFPRREIWIFALSVNICSGYGCCGAEVLVVYDSQLKKILGD